MYCATLTGGRSLSDQILERQREIAVGAQILRDHHAEEQDGAEAGDLQPAAAELHRARRDDRQHVEDREQALDAAGDEHRRGDDDGVDGEVHVGQPRQPLHEPQRTDEAEADREGQTDQKEERIDRQRARRAQLHDHRGAQQHRRDQQPDRDVYGEAPPERPILHQVSLLIRSKIGMYIAMTMPPTAPPRNAIITGSSSVSRPSTATSTSSS